MIENSTASPACNTHEVMKHLALDPPRVLHPDHHHRQQIFENPGGSEIKIGANLAHVLHHGGATFWTIDTESSDKRFRKRKNVVPNPGHW